MGYTLKNNRAVWLVAGLILGVVGAGMLPSTPLHAVSTDRTNTFAMATGPVDDEFEAVYFLDFLTGDLNAVVLGKNGTAFTAFYQRPGAQVVADLGVDPTKKANYMMVTGMTNFRGFAGAGQLRPSLATVYVAEVTSGTVAAYSISWSKNAHATGRMIGPAPLTPVAVTRFRAAPAVGPPTGLPPS